jgi:hypothetical protein
MAAGGKFPMKPDKKLYQQYQRDAAAVQIRQTAIQVSQSVKQLKSPPVNLRHPQSKPRIYERQEEESQNEDLHPLMATDDHGE